MNTRLRPLLRLAAPALLAAAACLRSAAQVVVAKQHYSFQSDVGTVQDDLENGPWMFLTQATNVTGGVNYQVTPPGSSALTLQNFTAAGTAGGPTSTAYYQTLFATQAELDAAFPDGGYSFATGTASASASVAGTYPDAPTVSFHAVQPSSGKDAPPPPAAGISNGAQWKNGVLLWDTTYDLTLTVHFPGTFVPGSSLLQMTFYGLPYTAATTPEYNTGSTSWEQSNAPALAADTLTATLTHGQNSPINLFEVVLTAQTLSTFDTNAAVPGSLIAGSHESRTSFFLEFNSYLGRPVRLTQQPPARIVTAVGATLTLSGGADGDPAPTYQWYHGQTRITGANSATLSYVVQPGDDNTYLFYYAANKLSQVHSGFCSLKVFNGPPAIAAQPTDQIISQGGNANFVAGPVGSPSDFTYQWYKDGTAIAGATSSMLVLNNVQPSDDGAYYAVITSPGGSTQSGSATLKVLVPTTGGSGGSNGSGGSGGQTAGPTGPPQAGQINSQIQPAGLSTVFVLRPLYSVGCTYQWYFNGAPIPGATSPLLLLQNVGPAQVGSYSCTATNSLGSSSTNSVTLSLTSGPFATNPGHLVNLSVLSAVAGSGSPFTIGFQVGGANTTGNETVLARATGPALAAPPFSLAGTLDDPTLALYSGGTVLTSNDNWGSNQAAVTAADAATGAFTLTDPKSLDAALTQLLGAGSYSVQITGNGAGAGTVLGEIYDTGSAAAYTPAGRRLINLSCINLVPAKGTLTAGFVVGGSGPRLILIRGIGPGLAPLGVSNVMADPSISVFATINGQQASQGQNSGWGGDATLIAACNAAGAFLPSDPNSHDSMVLMDVLPGSYSVQLTSASGAAGEALIEVYEVP